MPDPSATLIVGDALKVLTGLPDRSVDAVVTDPPYGLGFMGKAWDDLPPGREVAAQCLRVLRPGGHLLAFGGTRTWHRLAVAIEDAGFEIRDSIAWMYGQGFPKSQDVGKAIDKAAGAQRQVVSTGAPVKRMIPGHDQDLTGSWIKDNGREYVPTVTTPATPEATRWDGWGTALKPAFEPIVVGRRPLEGTVAANVLAHGTGALNIDDCRIGDPDGPNGGRWPANVALDEHAAVELDGWTGTLTSGKAALGGHVRGQPKGEGIYGGGKGLWKDPGSAGTLYSDSGGASRFMYCPKATAAERPVVDGVAHPTVKPLALMRWLVRLACPPGGSVLDPFAGTGTTLEAAWLEGMVPTGVEREPAYLPLVRHRLNRAGVPLVVRSAGHNGFAGGTLIERLVARIAVTDVT